MWNDNNKSGSQLNQWKDDPQLQLDQVAGVRAIQERLVTKRQRFDAH